MEGNKQGVDLPLTLEQSAVEVVLKKVVCKIHWNTLLKPPSASYGLCSLCQGLGNLHMPPEGQAWHFTWGPRGSMSPTPPCLHTPSSLINQGGFK